MTIKLTYYTLQSKIKRTALIWSLYVSTNPCHPQGSILYTLKFTAAFHIWYFSYDVYHLEM
jgi:hypothetical protein